jgi:hypothetical protein
MFKKEREGKNMGDKSCGTFTQRGGYPLASGQSTRVDSDTVGNADTNTGSSRVDDNQKPARTRLEDCSANPGQPGFPRQLRPGEIGDG